MYLPRIFYTVLDQPGFPVKWLDPSCFRTKTFRPESDDPGASSQEFQARIVGPERDATYLEPALFYGKVKAIQAFVRSEKKQKERTQAMLAAWRTS